jgi:hypothetical protein
MFKINDTLKLRVTENTGEKSSGSSSPFCLCTSKERGGVCLKTQLSWFCILLSNVTTCFGLAWPSSGRNVVNKEISS